VTTDELFKDAVDMLGEVLCGWSNMIDLEGNKMQYNKDLLMDVLSYQEARELMRKVSYNQHMTVDEKKS
jgi:hypothetical protein